jgi:ATP-dependent Lon protease
MRDFRDAKAMAQTLRHALKAKSVFVTHSESLELVARSFGFSSWNFLAVKIQASKPVTHQPSPMAVPTSTSSGSIVPIIPMRDLVLFPQMVTPVFVGRDKTRRAVERAMAADGRLLVVAQRRGADDHPALDALYPVGVIARVINCLTQVDGTLKLSVLGLERAAIARPVEGEFLTAEVMQFEQTRGDTPEAVALSGAVLDAYQVYAKVDYEAPNEVKARFRLPNIGEPGVLADSVGPLLSVGLDQKQKILATGDVVARLEMILELMKAGQQAA